MATIRTDNMMHINVLGVNILSFSIHHVRNGKTKYDVPKATNLTAHAEFSRDSYVNRLPKYAKADIGIPNANDICKLFSANLLSTNCRLVENQTSV